MGSEELGIQLNMLLTSGLHRILQLASVGMSVLGDDEGRQTADMHLVVHHEEMEAVHGN